MRDGKHRALVVDDDALVLVVSCGILEDAGFHALEATNVGEALDLLELHGSDVIVLFTDVEMPGGRNGFDLSQEVARRWPQIDIIIASVRVAPEVHSMPAKATFLGKPFSADIIHDHLRRMLPLDRRPPALDAS